MVKCSYCGSIILFDGKKEGDLCFCDDTCHQNGYPLVAAEMIPLEYIEQYAWEIYRGSCPKCHKQHGSIDVHTYHTIWSVLILTSWKSHPQISCRSCGVISQTQSLFSSLLLGWWGAPYGIIYTPIQIIKNIVGIVNPPKKGKPSEKLVQQVKLILGHRVLEQYQRERDGQSDNETY